MSVVKVRRRAQITLPADIRDELGIEEGDMLEARIENKRVVLIPQKLVPKFEEVELSEEGERMLDEAEAEVEAGKVREYDDVEDLIADLHDAAAGD
jgi:AbrB family looped-hinge helix DNA binding protein